MGKKRGAPAQDCCLCFRFLCTYQIMAKNSIQLSLLLFRNSFRDMQSCVNLSGYFVQPVAPLALESASILACQDSFSGCRISETQQNCADCKSSEDYCKSSKGLPALMGSLHFCCSVVKGHPHGPPPQDMVKLFGGDSPRFSRNTE